VNQPFSGSQSPDDARVAAIHKAKREVLEKAGVYLESLTIIEEGKLTKDQILALTSGVLKTEIVSQKPDTNANGFAVIVKVRVKIDSSVLEDRVRKLLRDRTAMEQLAAIRKRETELLDRIAYLEEVNKRLAENNEPKTTQSKQKELRKNFQQATRGLDAVALADQASDLWEDGKYTNPQKAIEILDKVIELDPGFLKAYINRGNAYYDLNQPYRAIQNYNKVIELDSGFVEAYVNRGTVCLHLKQYNKAIEDYNKVIELDEYLTTAYNNRGVAYKELHEYAKAIKDYDKVIELDPGDVMAYGNRGLAYFHLRNLSQGCADFKKACELGECADWQLAKQKGVCS